jgi:hypothetical protein
MVIVAIAVTVTRDITKNQPTSPLPPLITFVANIFFLAFSLNIKKYKLPLSSHCFQEANKNESLPLQLPLQSLSA